MLELKNLTYRIDDHTIFEDVNLSLSPGEILLIKGASGSGKSTLMQAIAGVVPQYSQGSMTGQILLNGEDITTDQVVELAGQIAYMTQDPETQLCTSAVKDELLFGMENLNFSKEKMKANLIDILQRFELDYMLDIPINDLSGGQKQLLALASIYAMEGQVILLDEPTANLDPVHAKKVFDLIKLFAHEEQKIVVLIEHNIFYIRDEIDKIFDMDSLSLVEDDLDYYIEAYRNSFKLPSNPNIPSQDIVLRAKDVSFAYDDKPVLKKIDFNLHKGEVIGIVGKNGAGKSTLVNCLSGLNRNYKGFIEIDEKELRKYKTFELGKKVGLVFQNPEHQFITLSVEEEMRVGLSRLNLTDEEVVERVDYYLNLFNLSHLREKNPYDLSQGQKRRLSTASLLIAGQDILILDEPTYGQDRENLIALLEILYEVNHEGLSIIMITHDEEVIAHACHSLLEIRDGQGYVHTDPRSYVDQLGGFYDSAPI